jgi:hypothetical protein
MKARRAYIVVSIVSMHICRLYVCLWRDCCIVIGYESDCLEARCEMGAANEARRRVAQTLLAIGALLLLLGIFTNLTLKVFALSVGGGLSRQAR